MFASYEVATSFPSLTAIKGYDLDKSADVPLMGHFYLDDIVYFIHSFDDIVYLYIIDYFFAFGQ